ncbi:MAG: heterocyst frequency control protein PatD [Synechococcus sp.]|nr:heterocyst frequency control protein PatD [Synechococcus sp.]
MNFSAYLQLQTQLQGLGINLESLQSQPGALVRHGQELLRFWQTQLTPLTGDDLPEDSYGSWRSLHTELYRGLRLLNTDLMFLQGSRTAQTQSQKQQQIQARLAQLERYCTEILKLGDRPTPAT